MKSRAASSAPTAILASPSTKLVDHSPVTGTQEGKVLFVDFADVQKMPIAPGSMDIDDLVAEFERLSPEGTEAIAAGRKWVAETFYGERPSIAQLRLQRGWSQAELAKHANTSQSYIARLELGKVDPQVSTALRIARALGVPIDTLINALPLEA